MTTSPGQPVRFAAEGIDLAGTIRYPDGPAVARRPGVVLTGPLSGVKEQVAGLYASRLARAGFVTLAFDHRGFGESAGWRGHEDTQGKLADLRAAVGVLAADEAVDPDRIAVVGVCLGGGYAVRAAAGDPRLRAVVGIAGGYNSPAWFVAGMGSNAYRRALRGFLDRYDEVLPAVAPHGGDAVMGGEEPFEYYGTERAAGGHWENRLTVGSLHSLMTFDALGAAELLGATPLLVVHGRQDDYCSPELAQLLHDRAAGPKELVWSGAGRHIDLYDIDPYVAEAVDATVAHLRAHL